MKKGNTNQGHMDRAQLGYRHSQKRSVVQCSKTIGLLKERGSLAMERVCVGEQYKYTSP